GRAELVRWTQEPAAPIDLRDEFIVKLRADAALDEVDLSAELRARIAQHTEKLAHYRAIEARDFALGDTMPRAKRLQHLILKKGILYEEGSIAWAQEALAALARQ
ncbi:MAG: PadR family transcriptional regulator, partial [Acidovorax sp.]|nr:PadR family transcriptional regulator [Acidovorax sp.]